MVIRLFCVSVVLLAAGLVATGCDKNADHASPITQRPCQLRVDSPADGEVDVVYNITYKDGRPAHVKADLGHGRSFCVGFKYDKDKIVAKTVDADCQGSDEQPVSYPVHHIQGSNLVRVDYPDDQTAYHYVAAPGDFSFLFTRTSYALGPQKIVGVDVEDGRLQSLDLPRPNGMSTHLEATYADGRLVRVTEKDAHGNQRGFAAFKYQKGRLVQVERKIATMQDGVREVVNYRYQCP